MFVENSKIDTHHFKKKQKNYSAPPKEVGVLYWPFEQRGREAQKRMWGIVGLAGRYPDCVLEQATARALTQDIRSYKRVRALAEQLLATAIGQVASAQGALPPDTSATPSLTQQHDLIRDPVEYAEFFALGTQRQSTTGDPDA